MTAVYSLSHTGYDDLLRAQHHLRPHEATLSVQGSELLSLVLLLRAAQQLRNIGGGHCRRIVPVDKPAPGDVDGAWGAMTMS